MKKKQVFIFLKIYIKFIEFFFEIRGIQLTEPLRIRSLVIVPSKELVD
jgi:hypothetical protein